MRKLTVQAMSLGLLLGLGFGIAPAIAQDSGIANTAEDFNSAEGNDGILGSNVSIFELMRRASATSGGATADGGFFRSQSRRIDREANSFLERRRILLEQRQAGEANQTNIVEPNTVELAPVE